jgi:L-aspartate oxidase
MTRCQSFDVAIIGGGIAGLSVALRLPEHLRVALFTKGQFGESNTRYAQGGLAVALGADDSPDLHFQDTMAAGAGLCDEEAVRILVEQAPSAVRWLMQMGVYFDRAEPGEAGHTTPDGLLLGREGAHCRWRVLHAGGDATGAEIERALTSALRTRRSIMLYEKTFVQDLLVRDGHCVGLRAIDQDSHGLMIQAQATVLASGGAGGLWLHTSNPAGATADGCSLAWRAGAALADLEFMQFHPTVLMVDDSSHLISEAVRGEGAYLRNHAGERFMPRYSSQSELAPRDVVARAILQEMITEQTDCQYLDLRHLPAEKVHARFPTISAICRQYGLDMATNLLPIAPAAHYCMGGILVDTAGRTTLPDLYAVGEVACTGVHGANRLASNSLLEGLVYGIRVADELTHENAYTDWHALRDGITFIPYDDAYISHDKSSLIDNHSSGNADEPATQQIKHALRTIMWQYVSLCRDQGGLLEARRKVCSLHQQLLRCNGHASLKETLETDNMLQIADLVIAAAMQRRESRGSHWRLDYQFLDQNLAKHHFAFRPLYVEINKSLQSTAEVNAHV